MHEADSDNLNDKADVPELLSDPWMVEFEQYINTNDIIPPSKTVVMWWGVHILGSWSITIVY